MIEWIEYYKNKGHVFGECMSKSDSDLMYINIPKNASSWTKPNLKDWGWEFYNYHLDNLYHKQALVVLRDPVDRWLSGIAEYLFLYHKNLDIENVSKDFIDLIFDRIAFDDHTDLQVLFLQKLDLKNCIFFKVDHLYREKFSNFLNSQGMQNRYFNYNYQHTTEQSKERKVFRDFFKHTIETDLGYKNKVINYFHKDYELLDKVSFL